MSIYQLNSGATTIANPISLYNLVSEDRNPEQIKTGSIQVGNACWAFRIDNFVYLKKTDGTFAKLTAGSGLTSAVFDSSLYFAYASNKVYKFTSTDYLEILNVTGLLSSV